MKIRCKIQVKDRFRKIVFDKVLQEGQNKINIENFQSGIYFLQSISESGIKTTKKLLKI